MDTSQARALSLPSDIEEYNDNTGELHVTICIILRDEALGVPLWFSII